MTHRMRTGFIFCAAAIAAGSGCSRGWPVSAVAELATISGYVYFQDPGGGEPQIADVLISVTEGDGSQRSALSNAAGFLHNIRAVGQRVDCCVEKRVHSKGVHLVLSNDTVLNFSLTR